MILTLMVRDLLRVCYGQADAHRLSSICCVGELIEEEQLEQEVPVTLDLPDDDDFLLPHEVAEMKAKEEELLEQIPLPGAPTEESARRKKWIGIPRRARAAIRRMHRDWGHVPRSVLKMILETSKKQVESTLMQLSIEMWRVYLYFEASTKI